ncbi:MAG: glycosyltransferase [Limisphaerales bacterium]
MTGQSVSLGGSHIFGKCILNVAFPFAPVSQDAVGGAEQILARIERGLVDAGGDSLVIANEDSEVHGALIPLPTVKGPITPEKQQLVWNECRRSIEEAVRDYDVDLIHFHGIDFHQYLPNVRVPKLATLHLPPTWYPADIFARARRQNALLHCVSQTQQLNCPASDALLPFIPNGVDVQNILPTAAKADFVLSLGRICPEKGFHLALDAAKRAEIKMFLADAVFDYETHCHYFETEIVPRLDHDRQFIGPVSKERKISLLARARCVLIPSVAPETSSLVAMEALACGTPVVAYPSGALSEIVHDGVNGFLVSDVNEMADAIKFASTISPQQCFEMARCRFDSQQMVSAYLRRYEIIIRGCNSFAVSPALVVA